MLRKEWRALERDIECANCHSTVVLGLDMIQERLEESEFQNERSQALVQQWWTIATERADRITELEARLKALYGE